ncbi:MAG: 1-(5-phosphoribosyl)-5-[(5-phosphoribosylamino)methylideneamino]imidazole-4-carboxamide isomerase [Chloroflexota bacterium]|jgi:phosphoribosylformimino-5-aminoimidazole carboxamide ribotide isomerase
MTKFTIYPAIDLRNGRVVRLEHGDPERQTVFSDDPVVVAQSWIDQGAQWLHVVNLDGAFEEGGSANWDLLPDVVLLDAKIQFGGGLRHIEDVGRALDLGVDRVILGTAAVQNPDLVVQAIRRYGPQRVAVGLDAKDGQIRIRGWRSDTALGTLHLARQMASLGVRMAVHTDIDRDGVLTGVNAVASAELARSSGLNVIASGGVASLDDVRRSKALSDDGVAGLIIGRALYDGRVDLGQAISIAKEGTVAG